MTEFLLEDVATMMNRHGLKTKWDEQTVILKGTFIHQTKLLRVDPEKSRKQGIPEFMAMVMRNDVQNHGILG